MALQNNKSLGQHWLKDRAILDEIAELSVPEMTEPDSELPLCLEIGPGLGTLTSSLLRIYPKVMAVEFDQKLAENLPKSFPGKNLDVINADFMDCDLDDLPKGYVVAANIPYYITSPIIMKLLTEKNLPAKIVLLIQKEVAERIVAGAARVQNLTSQNNSEVTQAAYPGKQTQLSLFVQNRAKVTLGPVVEREYFTPPPKVDSQVLILEPHAPIVPDEVMELIRRGFSSPRKKLIKNLGGLTQKDLGIIFAGLGISPDARPGDLRLADWHRLFEKLK
ncbi:ribosomal RNA small subunit methyltransferase A [Candidatus Saccharibacteria bacterium]|nr:ribosomal RNA small subunit methyltransferase A [Candidatus Saccharibacteria bacterium]